MTLDRGRLANIDRRILAQLNPTVGSQAVRVPVSDAVWSTWRRYCEVLGLSMGEGVASLIIAELETVVDVDGTTTTELAEQIAQKVEERSLRLDARQQELDAQAQTLRREEERLQDREWRLRKTQIVDAQARSRVKVGRNERCPCSSGLKYKHCHGRPE